MFSEVPYPPACFRQWLERWSSAIQLCGNWPKLSCFIRRIIFDFLWWLLLHASISPCCLLWPLGWAGTAGLCLFLVSFYDELDSFVPWGSIIPSGAVHNFDTAQVESFAWAQRKLTPWRMVFWSILKQCKRNTVMPDKTKNWLTFAHDCWFCWTQWKCLALRF